MRTKFNNSELAHIWASQSQVEGIGSSMFFDKTKIYSYGRHFVIAEIINNNTVLWSTRGYSNSTAKHKICVQRAIRHMNTIDVYDADASVLSNLDQWQAQIEDALKAIESKRTKEYTKEFARYTLREIVSNVEKYLAYKKFKLTKKYNAKFIAYLESARNEKADEKLAVALEKERRAEQKRRKEANKEAERKLQEYIARWLSGESVSTYHIAGINSVLLRESNGYVETSMGARVETRSAKLLLEMILAGRDIKGYSIDGYTVISMNGTLKIGCHEISRQEINRFALLRGWITEDQKLDEQSH